MLLYPLTALAAKLPSRTKLRLRRLRPFYTRIASFREPEARVQTCAGPLRWQADELLSQQFVFGTYEPQLQQALKEFVTPGAVVYDVGAHAGYISLTAALLAGSSGRVFSFEPRESNRRSIMRQMSLNPRLRITLMPFALSNRDGSASFDLSVSSSQGFISESGASRVDVRKIDSLVADGIIATPDLIKIDAEGHEAQVLEGGAATISSSRPTIICDYNAGDTLATMRRFLQPYGYRITAKEAVIIAAPN